jgi:hypothetical protein
MEAEGAEQRHRGASGPLDPPPLDPPALVGSQWWLPRHHKSKFKQDVSW